MEKWKTEGVDTLFLSGDLASTKPFIADDQEAVPRHAAPRRQHRRADQAQQVQQDGREAEPLRGERSPRAASRPGVRRQRELEVLRRHLQGATGKEAPRTPSRRSRTDGKIDDTSGPINDACQVVTMFADIGEKVGPYLNDTNWVSTVNSFGPIENRGSGPYSSLHTNKYAADDNWRLQSYDSSLGTTGHWKPITPLQNITG